MGVSFNLKQQQQQQNSNTAALGRGRGWHGWYVQNTLGHLWVHAKSQNKCRSCGAQVIRMLQNPLQQLLETSPKMSVRRQRMLLHLTCDHHQSWAISSAFPSPLLRFHLTSTPLMTPPSPHPPLHPSHPPWPHAVCARPKQTGQLQRDEGMLVLGHLRYWVVMGRLPAPGWPSLC